MAASKRGFAAMSKEKRIQIARMGGQASGGKFKKGSRRAIEAGRIGGSARSK